MIYLTDLDFLKSNQELMKFCILAKYHLVNNNLDAYAETKSIVITLIIKEFGQMPILWPGLIADKLIYEAELPTTQKESKAITLTPSTNDDSYNKEKGIITMNDLDWW